MKARDRGGLSAARRAGGEAARRVPFSLRCVPGRCGLGIAKVFSRVRLRLPPRHRAIRAQAESARSARHAVGGVGEVGYVPAAICRSRRKLMAKPSAKAAGPRAPKSSAKPKKPAAPERSAKPAARPPRPAAVTRPPLRRTCPGRLRRGGLCALPPGGRRPRLRADQGPPCRPRARAAQRRGRREGGDRRACGPRRARP